MKISTFGAFKKHVEGAEKCGFSALYLISAPEGGEGRLALDLVVDAIKRKEGIDSLGVRHLPSSDEGHLFEEIETGSFFSSKKIIIVPDSENLPKSLEARLMNPLPPGVFLILTAKEKGAAFFKKVEKVGIIVELGGEKSWEKERSGQDYIVQRFREAGREIDSVAAHFLAKESGGEIALLEQEVEKLLLYTEGKRRASAADAASVSVGRPAITTFQLAEALFKRDIPQAVKFFRALLEEGVAYFAILKQLRGQVRVDLEIASILRLGGNVQEITKSYPYIKGFILEKHLETVRTWGFDGLKRALVTLDDFEIRAKDGSAEITLLADLLIFKLC